MPERIISEKYAPEFIVEEQQLRHHRRAAEEAYVNRAYAVQHPRKRFIFRHDPDRRDQRTDDYSYDKTEHRYDDRILETGQHLRVAIRVYEHVKELVELAEERYLHQILVRYHREK